MEKLGKKVNVAVILAVLTLIILFTVLYGREADRFLRLTAEANTSDSEIAEGNICIQTSTEASVVNERKQLFVSCSGFLE